MPPRFVYWTIIAGGLPTAFRATERDELLPTFKRIQAKHPDAVMKYFARGKLWASPEEAQEAAERQRARGRAPDARGPAWRPGGEHRDPRQKFKDAKKERNLEWRKERFERRQKPGTTSGAGAPPRPAERRDWSGRPPGAGKPQGAWRSRPPGAGKPQSSHRPPRPGEASKPAPRPPRPPFRPPRPPDRGHQRHGPGKDPRRRS